MKILLSRKKKLKDRDIWEKGNKTNDGQGRQLRAKGIGKLRNTEEEEEEEQKIPRARQA